MIGTILIGATIVGGIALFSGLSHNRSLKQKERQFIAETGGLDAYLDSRTPWLDKYVVAIYSAYERAVKWQLEQWGGGEDWKDLWEEFVKHGNHKATKRELQVYYRLERMPYEHDGSFEDRDIDAICRLEEAYQEFFYTRQLNRYDRLCRLYGEPLELDEEEVQKRELQKALTKRGLYHFKANPQWYRKRPGDFGSWCDKSIEYRTPLLSFEEGFIADKTADICGWTDVYCRGGESVPGRVSHKLLGAVDACNPRVSVNIWDDTSDQTLRYYLDYTCTQQQAVGGTENARSRCSTTSEDVLVVLKKLYETDPLLKRVPKEGDVNVVWDIESVPFTGTWSAPGALSYEPKYLN